MTIDTFFAFFSLMILYIMFIKIGIRCEKKGEEAKIIMQSIIFDQNYKSSRFYKK